MAKFKITTVDGTFMVEAPDAQSAADALEQHSSQNYMGKTDENGVPEGMIYDPATNRMVDAKAMADKFIPGGSRPASWVKGIPFIGEYADEAVGLLAGSNDTENRPNESPEITSKIMREAAKTYEEEHPKEAIAGKIATGLTTLPAAVEFAPAALSQGSLLARSALGGLSGATLGGIEGAVSGYGEGEGDKRLEKAKERAKTSAFVGGVIGAATPIAVDTVSALAKKAKDALTVNRQVKDLGMNREAADTVAATLQADDTLGPSGMKRLTQAGDDAMLADAGDTASGLLDTTIQKGNQAGRLAQMAVQKRASEAGVKLRNTMDVVLGKPPGIDQAARDIAKSSQAARQAAYDAAYSKPIDYASEAGRNIEDVFSRTPPGIMRAAINEANDAMVANGQRNLQIMADIADDGTVTFRQMPNMIQVDELKKALNSVAASQVDQFGRKTAAGVRAAKLANELRDAARTAVPEYETALKLGGDKIAEDNALDLGYRLLRPGTTREEVAAAVDGITDAERKQLAIGLRQNIDDTMANVTQALNDPNMDAREAAKALKDMSSRAAREKLVLALGEKRANPLLKQLDEAQMAISLKSSVVTNSKTFARQAVDEATKRRIGDSEWEAVKQAKPLEAMKRLLRRVTGADAASQLAHEDAVYTDIAKLLTGPRGADAQLALQRLEKAYQTGQLNAQAARKIGEWIVGGADVTAYQFATR